MLDNRIRNALLKEGMLRFVRLAVADVNGRYEGIEAYGVGVVYDPCTMWLREGRQESYSVPRELDVCGLQGQ